jgi:hypothetical protein
MPISKNLEYNIISLTEEKAWKLKALRIARERKRGG